MADYNLPDSALVPTTQVYDIEEIEGLSEGLRNFLVQLTSTVNHLSLILNMKDTGYYTLNEFANSQYFYPLEVPAATYNTIQEPRPVYRKVINFGALPNTALKSVAHGIQGIVPSTGLPTTFRFTRIYGCATKPGSVAPPVTAQFIPIPYVSTNSLAEGIEIDVTATNVRIRTGSDRSAYTSTFVILEYVKES